MIAREEEEFGLYHTFARNLALSETLNVVKTTTAFLIDSDPNQSIMPLS